MDDERPDEFDIERQEQRKHSDELSTYYMFANGMEAVDRNNIGENLLPPRE